ncbi:MAG: PhzF family phenazine biosynthesis protein [Phycisphaerales bacterium]|jgi:PhzF family phenazine biosynthesis protein
MEIPYYQANAFTKSLFGGNPAGVCPLDTWLSGQDLQAIAAENNLSETAYFVRRDDDYELRWFTPKLEVDLCGHATLASAFVIFNYFSGTTASIQFKTKSGLLKVTQQGDLIVMDFPAQQGHRCSMPDGLLKGLRVTPKDVLLSSRDYLAVYDSKETIQSVKPDMELLEQLDRLGIIVTAPGLNCDFVSRFFAPRAGVPEDPVTGSAHCTLVPYWSEKLGKQKLHAIQLSRRRGELFCESLGDRVSIAGHAVIYLKGTISLSV